jgi:hypothetical protein
MTIDPFQMGLARDFPQDFSNHPIAGEGRHEDSCPRSGGR